MAEKQEPAVVEQPKQEASSAPAQPAQPSKGTPAEAGLLDDLKTERQKRQALELEVTELRKASEAAKNSKPAETKATQPVDGDDLRKAVAELQAARQRDTLITTLELRTEEQVAKVQEVLQRSPGLAPKEALAVAQLGNPELFGGVDQRAFNQGQHGSLRPAGAGPPAPVSLKEQSQAIAQLQMKDPIAGEKAVKDLHGRLLLDALRRDRAPGW